jgi:uncharacterized protein YpmB
VIAALAVSTAYCTATSATAMRASRASASTTAAAEVALRRVDEVDISQQRTQALNTNC